jgi:hypothetical protein
VIASQNDLLENNGNSTSATPTSTRNLDWIKQQLQLAIELECSTLPIYLSAMFSLQVQSNTAYNAIRSVVMEEMVHMAIACNILAAIGGVPRIARIQFGFPGPGLPGGVEPDLSVGLAKLSKEQLLNFMRIEMPDFLLKQANRDETYPTIAAFYQEIIRALKSNPADVRAAILAGGPANQVDDNIGFRRIQTKAVDPDENMTDDARADLVVTQILGGLDEILEQGEGSSTGSMYAGEGSEDEASHYNRFAELYYGRGYVDLELPVPMTASNESQFYRGRPIPFPTVVNTLAVPKDGYAKILALDPNETAVTSDLAAFDGVFSSILLALDQVWNGPVKASWKTLGGAVHSMVDLRVFSCFNLLIHQIPVDIVAQLPALYPDEFERMEKYSDLKEPLFYGPRFFNTNP